MTDEVRKRAFEPESKQSFIVKLKLKLELITQFCNQKLNI